MAGKPFVLRIVAVVFWLVNQTAASEFPKDIKQCNFGDTTCLAETINDILHKHWSGMPELDLLSLDPFHFKNASLARGSDSPVNINLTMSDGDVLGWRNARITKVIGFDKDPKISKFELHMSVPEDIVNGTYIIAGKILMIPVNGKGYVKFTLTDLDMKIRFYMKVEIRNGEEYIKLHKIEMDIYTKKVKFGFEDLFNSAELSNNFNNVLNENDKLVFDEIRVGFAAARAKVLKKLLAPAFNKVPYRQMFKAD